MSICYCSVTAYGTEIRWSLKWEFIVEDIVA